MWGWIGYYWVCLSIFGPMHMLRPGFAVPSGRNPGRSRYVGPINTRTHTEVPQPSHERILEIIRKHISHQTNATASLVCVQVEPTKSLGVFFKTVRMNHTRYECPALNMPCTFATILQANSPLLPNSNSCNTGNSRNLGNFPRFPELPKV